MNKYLSNKAVNSALYAIITLGLFYVFVLTNAWRFLDGFGDLEYVYSVSIYLQAVFLLILSFFIFSFLFLKTKKTIIFSGIIFSFLAYIASTYAITFSYRSNSITPSIVGHTITRIPLVESQVLERKWYGYLVESDTDSTPLLISASPLFNQASAIESFISDYALCREMEQNLCMKYELSWP